MRCVPARSGTKCADGGGGNAGGLRERPPAPPNADIAGEALRLRASEEMLPEWAREWALLWVRPAVEKAEGREEPEPVEPESSRRELGAEPVERLWVGLR